MEEIWKKVDGYTGYYVSNLGRIKSLKRSEPIIMKLGRNRLGYTTALLWNKENNKLDILHLSRIVLAAFKGYPADPWLCYAHHINGDLTDCRLENLEWLICETTDEYDPKVSHRKGVLKPKLTKERMTQAKYKQEKGTIQKAVVARMKTLQIRYGYKPRKDYE